jgi:hypothetical protein
MVLKPLAEALRNGLERGEAWKRIDMARELLIAAQRTKVLQLEPSRREERLDQMAFLTQASDR